MLNPPNPNRALNAFIVTNSFTGRARLRRRELGGQGPGRCFLGRRVLGDASLGIRLLVRRELGRRLLERRQLGLGLLGRQCYAAASWADLSLGQRVVGRQRGQRVARLLTWARSMTSSSRPSSPARWIPRHMQHAGSPVRGNRSSVPRTGDAPSPGRFYVPRWATRLRPTVRSVAKEYLRWKHLTRA